MARWWTFLGGIFGSAARQGALAKRLRFIRTAAELLAESEKVKVTAENADCLIDLYIAWRVETARHPGAHLRDIIRRFDRYGSGWVERQYPDIYRKGPESYGPLLLKVAIEKCGLPRERAAVEVLAALIAEP